MASVEVLATPPSVQPATAAQPPLTLLKRLQRPRVCITLLLLMWLPLTASVMFGGYIGDGFKAWMLAPAIPATIMLYAIAVASWRESTIAVIGVSLVFFWLFIAVAVPFMPL